MKLSCLRLQLPSPSARHVHLQDWQVPDSACVPYFFLAYVGLVHPLSACRGIHLRPCTQEGKWPPGLHSNPQAAGHRPGCCTARPAAHLRACVCLGARVCAGGRSGAWLGCAAALLHAGLACAGILCLAERAGLPLRAPPGAAGPARGSRSSRSSRSSRCRQSSPALAPFYCGLGLECDEDHHGLPGWPQGQVPRGSGAS